MGMGRSKYEHGSAGREGSPAGGGPTSLLIANAIVRLYVAHGGRGPTKARAFVDGDVVVCVLENVLTPIERTLVARGYERDVRELRTTFQDALREQMEGEVAEITDRPVRALFSQLDPAADAAVEVFLLERERAAPS